MPAELPKPVASAVEGLREEIAGFRNPANPGSRVSAEVNCLRLVLAHLDAQAQEIAAWKAKAEAAELVARENRIHGANEIRERLRDALEDVCADKPMARRREVLDRVNALLNEIKLSPIAESIMRDWERAEDAKTAPADRCERVARRLTPAPAPPKE